MHHNKRTVPWQLYAIFTSFLAPVLLAYWLFFSGYGHNHTVNRGTLLTSPGILLSSHPTNLPAKWIIAHVATQSSPPENLSTISKRWAALGKEQHRVTLTTLLAEHHPLSQTPWPKTSISEKHWQSLTSQKTADNQPCYYFLIDPSHHAILCYPETVTPKDIDTDLRKLLKYSRSG